MAGDKGGPEKKTKSTEDNSGLASGGSEDSLEIVSVVPAPKDDERKPAAKVKTEPTTPSSKPPTPKSGNTS
jgi:hypothetical protein